MPTTVMITQKAEGKMTPEEIERIKYFCKRIQEEQDQKKFNELVTELNSLLEAKERRLRPEAYQPQSN